MTAETPAWRKWLKVHPAADDFPMMSDAELIELGNDIKKHGLKSPIALMDGPGKCLLDGRNRLEAMQRVGIDVVLMAGPTIIKFGPKVRFKFVKPDTDAKAYVASANIHRRHLTPDKRRELIANLLKADPSKSDRRIAETANVSPTTVGTVRKKLEATVQLGQLPKRRGKDGKSRTAKPRKSKPSSIAPVMTAVPSAPTRTEAGSITRAAITLVKSPADGESKDGIPPYLDRRGPAHVASLIVDLHRAVEKLDRAGRIKAIALAVEALGEAVTRHDDKQPAPAVATEVLSLAIETRVAAR